jgi:hypothetical protein
MSNLFNTLEIEAFRKGLTLRSKESQTWFRRRLASMRPNRASLMKDNQVNLQTRIGPGTMAMFYYDPKHKETLPYYDRFPLIILVDRVKGGFHGLNLHYLPPTLRAKFLDGLMDNLNNKLYDETTRFKVNYQMLQRAAKLKYFKACYKMYLNDHVRSKFAEIEAPEWEIATFLPTADFEKSTRANVYKDSRRLING